MVQGDQFEHFIIKSYFGDSLYIYLCVLTANTEWSYIRSLCHWVHVLVSALIILLLHKFISTQICTVLTFHTRYWTCFAVLDVTLWLTRFSFAKWWFSFAKWLIHGVLSSPNTRTPADKPEIPSKLQHPHRAHISSQAWMLSLLCCTSSPSFCLHEARLVFNTFLRACCSWSVFK